MRWFKVAAIAAGVLIAFLVVSSIVGLFIEVAIAALIVASVVLAIKVAFYRRQVARNKSWSEIREPAYSNSRPRRKMPDGDDELSRLKREMGGQP
jgi:high-affinity Fe2+/Pb2+ permease